MMSDMKNLLERLSNAHRVSGYENNIRKIIEEEIRPFVDDIRTDKMGNLVATRSGGSPRLMLVAHMDEIGLMVKYVDDNGFIYFSTTGGWFDQTLLNQRMILHTVNAPLYGVIGSKPPHAMKDEEMKKPIKADAEGRGIIVPEPVSKWLKNAAESGNIPYQLKVGSGGQTDASIIHLTREGIYAGIISTPSRYIHTPVTVLSLTDLENSIKLIVRAVKSVDSFF